MPKTKQTFSDLIEQVQVKGLCNRCGGCVSFCSAINYGALEVGEEGYPRYLDREKCIECGLCYLICPEIGILTREMQMLVNWQPPMGHIIRVSSARAADPVIREHATDGGAVTAILCYLLDNGYIDGAIVSRHDGPMHRRPYVATTREEIIGAAGSFFDQSQGPETFGHSYTTYSPSVQAFDFVKSHEMMRFAMVGTPCQINTVRKMQTLGIVPAPAIRYKLGLFCMENLSFDEPGRKRIEAIGGFRFSQVRKINVKDEFMFHLQTGETVTIPFEELEPFSRPACLLCSDYAAEYADISFGGVGSGDGWTTVITRTTVGEALYVWAAPTVFEEFPRTAVNNFTGRVLTKIGEHSDRKKARARKKRERRNV
jgi:coenzyme F420 hydrogenase subunit beta